MEIQRNLEARIAADLRPSTFDLRSAKHEPRPPKSVANARITKHNSGAPFFVLRTQGEDPNIFRSPPSEWWGCDFNTEARTSRTSFFFLSCTRTDEGSAWPVDNSAAGPKVRYADLRALRSFVNRPVNSAMSAPNRCRAHVCVRVARRVQLGGGARGGRWRCCGHVVVVSEAGMPAGASGGEGGGRLVEDGRGGSSARNVGVGRFLCDAWKFRIIIFSDWY